MRLLGAASALIWALWASALWADARLTVLVEALKLHEAAQILSEEGLSYAEDLNAEMLGGQGGGAWAAQVGAIYDPARMVEMVRRDLKTTVFGQHREEVIAFYHSDLGRRIIGLENTARAAIRDPDIEAAARARYAALEGSDDARLALIRRMTDEGDMITRNVISTMNSNYQFMRGMAEGGALEMDEEEMLRDVAGEMEEITEDTTGWLLGFMLMAYSPLSEAELNTYVAFAASPAGQALNTALFDGFGKAYEDISYALGRAVALNMVAEEL